GGLALDEHFGRLMTARTPTRRQRLIASDWPERIWLCAFPVVFAVGVLRSIPLRYAFDSICSAGLVVVVLGLSLVTGLVLSIPAAWILFGSILMEQGLRNGGPFKPGDLVQVIAGPHRNRIARVYSTWQCETVRVDLGEAAKSRFQDIFASHQLLRVEPADPSHSSEATSPTADRTGGSR
ncbi:MAG: KOW motif-containing protein, partial [Thermoguttaceae bacterium]